MLRLGQDVELFASVGAMTVPDETQVLQYVEGAVDGRRNRPGVRRATTLDELGRRDVTARVLQDAQEKSTLRGPAQPARMQLIACGRPGVGTCVRSSGTGWCCAHADEDITCNAALRNCNIMQQCPKCPKLMAA